MLDLAKLPWLRQSPVVIHDFLDPLKNDSVDNLRLNLFRLSAYALNTTQLQTVARKTESLFKTFDSPFPAVRMAVLGNTTTHYLSKGIASTGFRYKLHIQTFETEFDQIQQAILDPNSALYTYNPHVILLNIDWRGLPLCTGYTRVIDNGDVLFEQSKQYILNILETLQRRCKASIILQTLAPPPMPVFGHFDAASSYGFKHLMARFNAFILDLQKQPGLYIFDVDGLASMVGLSRWHDANHWYLGKLSFSQELLPLYCDHVCRIVSSIKSTTRKVLVLDLDNTLWGGIIGDDGLHGLKLGLGDGVGEAFCDVQHMVKALKTRGIVLAVCSKNTQEIALSAFQSHPEMILKEDDMTLFQANWTDKAANINYIARALNLSLDSLVFMDDNPAERERIRQELPDVAVLEMPEDPSYYPFILSNCGYFETFHMSDEDLKRSDYYKNNLKRDEILAQTSSLEDYLKSLAMTVTFQPFDAMNRQRILQLINKSNQYNLTTRRYTEQELLSIENDPHFFCLQVRLSDCFGDNGMISVVLCEQDKQDNTVWSIDTWLMSCRVLGRKVEFAVLNHLVHQARLKSIQFIRGFYCPTAKNALVADHYEKLGFSKESSNDHGTQWILNVKDYTDFSVPMTTQECAMDTVCQDVA